MSDWLIVVPRLGAPTSKPDPHALARALRAPHARAVSCTHDDGALFFTTSEAPDDPDVVVVHENVEHRCAVAASALLTERELLVSALRGGGRPASTSAADVTLLAQAVAAWGEEAWARPGGEFAAVAWFPAARSALLATDGEGARPVFWANSVSGFAASTRFEAMPVASAMLRAPVAPNPLALLAYLAVVRELPDSGCTWLADVEELPPGHALHWHDGHIERRRWWAFPRDVAQWRPRSNGEAAERFRLTLRQSVRERLRGHRRVAIALSGGMDSTAVAAEATALRDEAGADLELTAVHAEYPAECGSTEMAYARDAATALRVPFEPVAIGDTPVWPLTEAAGAWPPHHWFGMWTPMAATLSRYGSAVLTGTSGEIFSMARFGDAFTAGIPADLFSAWRLLNRLGLPFRPWQRGNWRHAPRPFAGAAAPLSPWIRPEVARAHGLDELRAAQATWQPPVGERRLASLYAFLTLLRRSNQMFDLGAVRLPTLNPFADRRVVQLALSVPPVPWRLEKALVRSALVGVLPRSVLARRREPTPWLARPFLESASARQAAQVRLHSAMSGLVDEARWRSSIGSLTTFREGHSWLAVLAANAWLARLDP